jgi:hypothetical protein
MSIRFSKEIEKKVVGEIKTKGIVHPHVIILRNRGRK